MAGLAKKLDTISHIEQKLAVKKTLLLNKALEGDNPTDIIKAASVVQGLQNRESTTRKSYLIDPLDFQGSMGYKDKPYALSYNTLRRMSKVPIINAILKTRKNQVASFCEPQSDKYATGFVIRKKQMFGNYSDKPTPSEARKIAYLTDFILNCGENNNFAADDFDTFIRKIVDDSLVFDQMCFEVIRNRRGELTNFVATDAATFRIASTYDDDMLYDKAGQFAFEKKEKVNGYYPSYVQVLQGVAEAEFYPWELCFGIRNPSSNVNLNGYGVSELEEMVNTITSMLYSEEYNRRFFSQGSAPKGILRVKGNTNSVELQQFKQQWKSMLTGVMGAWKTPVLENEVEWIDLQKSNRDMEFGKWMDYLIKQACAIYSIDSSEIGFTMSGSSSGQQPMFEGKNEAKLKHSQDKGLTPLLKFIQRKLNKYIISQIDPTYEFVFVGMDGLTMQDELEMDLKKLNSFAKVNEIREKYDMKSLGDKGDFVNSSFYLQNKTVNDQKAMQEKQMQGQANNGGQEEEQDYYNPENPFEEDLPDEVQKAGIKENVFAKAFTDHLNEIK